VAAAWRARSADLASWAWARLVNRTDAWGGYRPPAEVGAAYTRPDGKTGKYGSQTTRPAPSRRGRELLTADVLARHFAGRRREDLVGLHSTSPENTSRWGALDIDWHGPSSTAPAVNLRAALAWYGDLAGRRFRPLLADSNGAGGFHLWVIFSEPIPTPRVHAFLKDLAADHDRYGLGRAPEVFPKQSLIRPGGFGNWFRLPGRHHTRRDHWSRVWDGGSWQEGRRAVEHVLALAGDPPDLVPEVPARETPRQARPTVPYRPAAGNEPAAGNDLRRRIEGYMARLPNLGAGQGRDDVAYAFAAWLARDLGLSDAGALGWLARWDSGNRPPKGGAALVRILANVRLYGRSAVGSGLGRARRAGRPRREVLRFGLEVPG
jgi:hypothetical protein